ncbi:VOC family protein [Microvirga massiliensis]|uniref:VOC family protein n=1 Tax=Microvirga massiliensis TaxID=1033741 RepID=UPI00069AB921|nr:VOC family protein [Microvirga massiliensis]
MIDGLGGVDHVVVLVRDLDRARDTWAALGFTLSPRGVHSAHRGTGNHTIMLGPDYLELVGILSPTEHNAPSRALLERREGIERAGLRARDVEVAAADLRRRGIAITGPQDFSRPVDLPGDGTGEARFRTIQWPFDCAPAGMRIFAVQHLTPELVWLPALQQHANTARRLLCLEVLAHDPAKAAAELSELIGMPDVVEQDGGYRIQPAPDRAAIVYLDRASARQRYPEAWLEPFTEEGGLAVTFEVGDLDAAAQETGGMVLDPAGRVGVPPNRTSGVILNFVI